MNHYQRVRRRMSVISLASNAVGALLTMFYFYVLRLIGAQIEVQDRTTASTSLLIAVAITSLLLFIGGKIADRKEERLWTWYEQALREPEPPSAPPDVKELALNLPFRSATMSMIMWTIAGLTFSSLNSLFPSLNWGVFFQNLFGITGIAGTITTVILYFATERAWRDELPFFFPEGQLTDISGFRMTVRRRMLVLFGMSVIPLLLLAILSYTQASQIVNSENPAALLPRLLGLELFLAGVSVAAVVVLSQTLGSSLVDPLEELERRMDEVQSGNLEVRIPVTSNDEIGQLAEGFNAMVEGLGREEVVRRLFSQYVTEQVADYAIEHGAELGAQRTEASVLFTDIRGFTSLTEQMPPVKLIDMLNRYYQALADNVTAQGGLVNKFGGDSLLAVFGTPINPLNDHASRAVDTACSMIETLERFNREQEARDEPTLRIGIGIATGTVLAGNVGSEERMEYTVIGDAVNLASRLEALTKETEATILLSGTTADARGDRTNLEAMGLIDIRGKKDPVRVFAVRTNNVEREQ